MVIPKPLTFASMEKINFLLNTFIPYLINVFRCIDLILDHHLCLATIFGSNSLDKDESIRLDTLTQNVEPLCLNSYKKALRQTDLRHKWMIPLKNLIRVNAIIFGLFRSLSFIQITFIRTKIEKLPIQTENQENYSINYFSFFVFI